MRRIDSSLVLAISVSLCVHVALGFAFVHYAVSARLAEVNAAKTSDALPDVEPDPSIAPTAEFMMGEATGKGYASHEVESPFESKAREADADQAFLSLDPVGAGGTGSDAAVSKMQGTGANRGQPGGAPASEIDPSDSAKQPSPAAFGVKSELKLPNRKQKTRMDSLISPAPAEVATAGQDGEAAHALSAPSAAAQSTPMVSASTGTNSVGSGQPAADPARMSDSESDPFSRLGSAVFQDGALQVSFGRKVKTRTPKLLLGAQEDLFIRGGAKVVLKIEIDSTGKVTGVDVLKSSGSNAIDQPTRLAVYDWWFEPRKDPAGNATADQIQFTISWR